MSAKTASSIEQLGPGSGMWRFSLPPIPRSPPSMQPPRVPPRSSYQEKREPNAVTGPVRALTAWSSPQLSSTKGLTGLKPGPDVASSIITPRNNTHEERRPSVVSTGSESDSGGDEEETKLRRRCAALEAELELERSQKVRGTNKFMGGGQFKSAANNKVTRQCPSCFTLRETIQKMKVDCDEVIETNTYLVSEVERLKAELEQHVGHLHGLGQVSQDAEQRIKRLEAERDALSTAAAEHRAAAAAARIELEKKSCAFDSIREQLQGDCKHLKEEIRKIQEQLGAREREVEQFKQTAQQFEQRTAAAQARLEQVTIDFKEVSKVRDLQAKRLELQEQQIRDLTARLAEFENRPVVEDRSEYIQRLEHRISELEKQTTAALADLEIANRENVATKDKLNDTCTELSKCRDSLETHVVEVARLGRELDTNRARVSDLIVSNDDLKAVNAEMIATVEQLERDKTELERQLAEMRRSSSDDEHLKQMIQMLQAQTSELNQVKATLEQTVEENAATIRDQRLTMENLKEDVRDGEVHRRKLEDEISELKRKLREAEDSASVQQELASKATKACTMAETELKTTRGEVEAIGKVAKERKDEIGQLKRDVAKKDKTILDLMDKHLKDLERAKQEALEKTMQSMVRLCVVAPTVNVSFGSEALTCKAGLPGERIHEIIETQILPGFIQLFLQPKEGIGPDGTQLSKWVERLMGDMQGSIEKHLAGVFKAAGKAGNG